MSTRWLLPLASILHLCYGSMADAVQIVELIVPESPQAGQDVKLTCRFMLLGHNHRLYTVNWWRGKDQFYTYKATSIHAGPRHAYTFAGIHVQTDQSNEESVMLRNVTEETSGLFKCEVMGEGPSFRTAVAHKQMTVVVPPSSVEISSNQIKEPAFYFPGDRIHLNCTARGAKPRAHITWDINGTPVRKEDQNRIYDYEDHQGRVTSIMSLSFEAPRYFANKLGQVRKEDQNRIYDYEDHQGRVTSIMSLSFEAPRYFANKLGQVRCEARVANHAKMDTIDLYLHPASSAAYNHQYASAGCQAPTMWTMLSLASLLLAPHRT